MEGVRQERRATAVATSNIALVKYWGKRDAALNLPATGSISVTLDGLRTRTTVAFEEGLEEDEVRLDGAPGDRRTQRFLDVVRGLAGIDTRARVTSANDFPTGAGLASSASGFAALAVACDAALDLGLPPAALSALARRGSGSAARSLVAGFAEMRPGTAADGHDAHAVSLAPPEHVPLRVLVALTTRARKAVGSGEAMRLSEATSPFHGPWLAATARDLDAMRHAVQAADLEAMGTVAERSCLLMHAVMMASDPPLLYWNPATVGALRAVQDLRAAGTGTWFTIDAGPQVKALCAPADAPAVEAALRAVPGVLDVLTLAPGAGARVVEVAA
jgi:diphosphomevalonate decarboxylase